MKKLIPILLLSLLSTLAQAEVYIGLYSINSETETTLGTESSTDTPDGAVLFGFRGDGDFAFGAEFFAMDKGTGGTLNLSMKITPSIRITGGAVIIRDSSTALIHEETLAIDDSFQLGEFLEISYGSFALRGVQYNATHDYGYGITSNSDREQYWVGYVTTF